MTALYTSYSTSVALRDAGAPQAQAEKVWYFSETSKQPRLVNDYPSGQRPDPMNPARAFRADEIIEALGDRLDAIDRYGMPGATYRVALSGERGSHVADSLVETLAAAWLAVLKEDRRG